MYIEKYLLGKISKEHIRKDDFSNLKFLNQAFMFFL